MAVLLMLFVAGQSVKKLTWHWRTTQASGMVVTVDFEFWVAGFGFKTSPRDRIRKTNFDRLDFDSRALEINSKSKTLSPKSP
jgi:hypothetical protein